MSHYFPPGCNCCTKHGCSKFPRVNIIKTMKLLNKIISCSTAGESAGETLSRLRKNWAFSTPLGRRALSSQNPKMYLLSCICYTWNLSISQNSSMESMNLKTVALCFPVCMKSSHPVMRLKSDCGYIVVSNQSEKYNDAHLQRVLAFTWTDHTNMSIQCVFSFTWLIYPVPFCEKRVICIQ